MKIIVNADDFGHSKKVNQAIINCHKNGILTSTSILAGGDAFANAIDLAEKYPALGIGIHLDIDKYFPKENRIYYNKLLYSLRYTYDKKNIFNDLSMQIEKILNNKIKPTHLDFHHHLHLYFPILNIAIELAKKYQIKYIRSQKIILPISNSYLNSSYRKIHQFYLKKRYNTIDGYFYLSSLSESVVIERIKILLQSVNNCVEIIVHPKDILDHESKLLTTDGIIQLFQPHSLITYSGTKKAL